MIDQRFHFCFLETKCWRLGDVGRGTERVSWGREVILQIWRLGGNICGAHGASVPPPSLYTLCVKENLFFSFIKLKKFNLKYG